MDEGSSYMDCDDFIFTGEDVDAGVITILGGGTTDIGGWFTMDDCGGIKEPF